MSKHLFAIICTHHGTASNNRGETEGNTTTLQKILWRGDVHSTVSAEAIRWALRQDWQDRGLAVNRRWDEDLRRNVWTDAQFAQGASAFVDDDVLGFMSAQAASQEANPAEEASAPRRGRARGTTTLRRGRLEITRAVSLVPWRGDVVFSVASVGATPSAQRQGGDFPVPYSAEVHATRYQYGLALTPESLADPSRGGSVVDALVSLREVAGNHSRFFFDFSPASVIFRWTDDFAPRMLYGFDDAGRSQVRAETVVRRVQAGDIDAHELVVGGEIAESADGAVLKDAGAFVAPGVRAAAEEVKRRLAEASA